MRPKSKARRHLPARMLMRTKILKSGNGDRGGDGVELLRFTSGRELIRTVPQRPAPGADCCYFRLVRLAGGRSETAFSRHDYQVGPQGNANPSTARYNCAGL